MTNHYFGLEDETLWKMVQVHVPDLLHQIRPIIGQEIGTGPSGSSLAIKGRAVIEFRSTLVTRGVVRLAWLCDAFVIVSEAGPRPSLRRAELLAMTTSVQFHEIVGQNSI